MPNQAFTKFIADKIRARVDDPAIAAKLIPTDHGFGTHRAPMETNFYEAFNRDNLHPIHINETPIEPVTQGGIKTSGQKHELDTFI